MRVAGCMVLLLVGGVAGGAPLPECKGGKCKNVVYIISDDLQGDLGAMGRPVLTPNLDALVQESMLFRRTYCQISVCAPSRMSFMTSLRPDTHGVWNFIDTNPVTSQATPGHFRDHGYLTLGLGKGFHQDAGAWNQQKYWSLEDPSYPYFNYSSNKCPHGNAGGGHCILPDGDIWDWSLRQETLKYVHHAADVYRNTSRPFFLMSGFRDPHAPWAAPQRMWDLYEDGDIKIAESKVLGKGTPLIAWSHQLSCKLMNGTPYMYGPTMHIPDWVARDQRHGYYAAVSYVDEHVGDIVKAIKDEGLYNDTILVFHADHGYLLGEHGYWEKKANFETIVRVPLVIRVPGKAPGFTDSLTELVDVFPTLAAAAGLPAPDGVDGDDVSILLDDPTTAAKAAAYHQYPACHTPSLNHTRQECNNDLRDTFDWMSYSVRTDSWRYTVWYRWNKTALKPLWEGEYGEELYDHVGDDGSSFDFENVNLAQQHPDVSSMLREQIRGFFSKH